MLELRPGSGKDNGRHRQLIPAEDEIREKAHKLCMDYLHGAWLTIQSQDMILRRVSGGLSNLLYYVSLPEGVKTSGGEPQELLVRLYGQVNSERAMETLVTESVIFTLLSESQRGPRLYGVFPGGRLEEYIQARPLLTRELATYSTLIADKVAQTHLMEVPINKQPKWLWQTMQRWIVDIEDLLNTEPTSEESRLIINKVKQLNLSEEFIWLKKYLTSINSPVVFCHNDLQEGNILLREAPFNGEGNPENEKTLKSHQYISDDLVVIDYEYCSYNYRGFDFANHFCEWMYDYTNENPPYFWASTDNCPSQEQQEEFFEQYLSSLKKSTDHKNRKQDTIPHLITETKAFTLASHFFWGLWSVVNSSVSGITFDYWGYGEARFKAYFEHKMVIFTGEH